MNPNTVGHAKRGVLFAQKAQRDSHAVFAPMRNYLCQLLQACPTDMLS